MAMTQILERPEGPFASRISAIAGMRLPGGPEYLTTPCARKVTICSGVKLEAEPAPWVLVRGVGSVALLLAARSAGAALVAWWASELVAGKLLIGALLLLGCLIANVEVLTGTRLGDKMTEGYSRN
jgi:hypothetical protein